MLRDLTKFATIGLLSVVTLVATSDMASARNPGRWAAVMAMAMAHQWCDTNGGSRVYGGYNGGYVPRVYNGYYGNPYVNRYYGNRVYNNGYYNNGYYNSGYYNNGYYNSGYNGYYNNGYYGNSALWQQLLCSRRCWGHYRLVNLECGGKATAFALRKCFAPHGLGRSLSLLNICLR